MKFTLYKPNSKNTGSAFTFDSTEDRNGKPTLFVSMIQQYSWDEQRKTGSFKENAKNEEKSTTVKLTDSEAGEFLSSFKSRIPFVGFHKTQDKTTVIKLTPWDKTRLIKNKDGQETYKTPAWGLTITKNSAQFFKLPIEAGEAEVLSVLLEDYIGKSLASQASNYKNNPVQKKQETKSNESFVDEEDDDVPF